MDRSREDREEAINKRIELLKQKNEQLLRRHQEIQSDKQQAEKSGRSVNLRTQSKAAARPRNEGHHSKHQHYGTPHMDDPKEVDDRPQKQPQNRDRHYQRNKGRDSNQQRPRPNYSEHGEGDTGLYNENENGQFDNNGRNFNKENSRGRRRGGRGRGYRGRGGNFHGLYSPRDEDNNVNEDPITSQAQSKGRGFSKMQEYEQKRRANIESMEEELKQLQSGEAQETASRTKFLDDPRRQGSLNVEDQKRSSRHKGNFGGEHFSGTQREFGNRRNFRNPRGNRGRGQNKLQMSAEMTGRERIDYERWSEMKKIADDERLRRSKDGHGNWRRQWDIEKQNTCPDDVDHQRKEAREREKQRSTEYDQPDVEYRHEDAKDRGRKRSNRGRRKRDGKQTENLKDDENYETQNAENDIKDDANTSYTIPNNQAAHDKQLRNETPSSKDGTEVWAQTSHNSEDSGKEWKNGIKKCSKKWVNEDVKAKPAIDERKLEQEAAGATVYSQKLGRGWGEEKNKEATKAWVKQTEEAVPENIAYVSDELLDKEVTNDGDGYTHDDKKLDNSEIASLRKHVRSCSPRLKPDLTVNIDSHESRRMTHHSEGDSRYNKSPSNENNANQNNPTENVTSPTSPFPLKTPDGVTHVGDWATEVEIQSPTYKSKQEDLNATKESDNIENKEIKDKKPSADNKEITNTKNEPNVVDTNTKSVDTETEFVDSKTEVTDTKHEIADTTTDIVETKHDTVDIKPDKVESANKKVDNIKAELLDSDESKNADENKEHPSKTEDVSTDTDKEEVDNVETRENENVQSDENDFITPPNSVKEDIQKEIVDESTTETMKLPTEEKVLKE